MNCSNAIGKDYCTMHKDMTVAQYKKCDGHKTLPKKVKKPVIIKPKKIRAVLGDEHFSNDFMRFLKKGGSYSLRTGRVLI